VTEAVCCQNTRTCTIIVTGTEITRGLIQDNHMVFLGQELQKAGMSVNKMIFIPDNYTFFKNELVKAVAESSIVIITGGLGPTPDDLTRDVVADVAELQLVFKEKVWEEIKKRSWNKKIPDSNKKQAFIPEGFTVLPNTHGTACGFHGHLHQADVFALPGPPFELQQMFLQFVVPVICNKSTEPHPHHELICSVYMVSESYLADCFHKAQAKGVSMQTRLEKDRIVLTLYGGMQQDRERIFSALVSYLGKSRIQRGDKSLAQSVLDKLIEKEFMLVCAESCTGGLLGTWLTDIPGSSRAFWGSFVTYSNKAKTALLGVDSSLITKKGAVSKEVVEAMARGGLEKSGGDICIAVSGIAGPTGGSEKKPVGTVWIALHMKNGIKKVKSFHFKGNRERVRRKSAITCLFFIESALLGDNVLDIPAKW
jgi:nicotinamide-nucleotide amidase